MDNIFTHTDSFRYVFYMCISIGVFSLFNNINTRKMDKIEEMKSLYGKALDVSDAKLEALKSTMDLMTAYRVWEKSPERLAAQELSREYRLIKEPTMGDIPDYGDHMTLEEFVEACKTGAFINYDGFGNYATKDTCSDIQIYPSDITAGKYRSDFTHVIWFNR